MTTAAMESVAEHEAIRRRVRADVVATERRIAELRDEIAEHERHLADIRQFQGMLNRYAAAPEPGPDAESSEGAPADDGDARGSDAAPAPPERLESADAAALREAIRARLPAWTAWINQLDGPDRPPSRRSDMSYAVLSMCQCLCMAETGEEVGQDDAVEWALANFDEPWCTTVERSLMWQSDAAVDETVNTEARRFVRWAVERVLNGPD